MENKILIGSDEALKGDTFGGIVVAGVCCDDEKRKEIEGLGIRDSKKLTDRKVELLAEVLMEKLDYCVKSVFPKEYNEMHARLGNVSRILDKLHAEVALGFEGDHVVDQYPGCGVGDIIETKAEDKYVEVAAASIIARHHALLQIKELSKLAGFRIPLGSTHVKGALEVLKSSELDPNEFVKLHFKNVKAVLG